MAWRFPWSCDRELSCVASPILLELFLVLNEALLRVLELCLQKLIGAVGLAFPIAQILLDVQRGQTLGDLACRFRVIADEADAK